MIEVLFLLTHNTSVETQTNPNKHKVRELGGTSKNKKCRVAVVRRIDYMKLALFGRINPWRGPECIKKKCHHIGINKKMT